MAFIHITTCPVCKGNKFNYKLKCKDNLVTNEEFQIFFCDECHFAFTQDFPSENEIWKYYQSENYISHSDNKQGFINKIYHLVRKYALYSKAKIISKFSGLEEGKLLDIGAGTGYFLNYMKQKSWNVLGIEKSEDARSTVIDKFGISCYPPDYLFNLREKSMDVITMWHVLEHMENTEEVLFHINRILTEEGTAVIALPNKNSIDAKYYKSNWAAYDVPRHLWHFSPENFIFLADKHNFQIIKTYPMHQDTFYISMLSEKSKDIFLATFTGLIKGSIFFIRSLFNPHKASSIIYILKKK